MCPSIEMNEYGCPARGIREQNSLQNLDSEDPQVIQFLNKILRTPLLMIHCRPKSHNQCSTLKLKKHFSKASWTTHEQGLTWKRTSENRTQFFWYWGKKKNENSYDRSPIGNQAWLPVISGISLRGALNTRFPVRDDHRNRYYAPVN